jgi:hypothetical protein
MGYQLAGGPKKLAITATPTAYSSMIDFADIEFHRKYLLPFYDKYLKGWKTSYDDRPDVEYIVRNTGKVRSFRTWPPPKTQRVRYFLGRGPTDTVHSLNDGALGTEPLSPAGGSTAYSYPQPSWVLGVVPIGPQGPDPVRAVLTFTSQPLPSDMEIAGSGKLTVYASSTRNDMDFIVKVSEQFEQSAAERAKGFQPRYTIVTKGWHRASHMDLDPVRSTEEIPYYTHSKTTPLVPGQIYKIEIPLLPIAYRFQKGSRVRVEIAPHDSPVTDGLFIHAYRPDKIGTDTIYHDVDHPSQLLLPVLRDD